MKGILALVGSGEFTPAMDEVDKFLLSKISNPKVAILPTAAGKEEDYHKWIADGLSHFQNLGADAEGIHIISRDQAEDRKLAEKLSGFNLYYFSGGDPGYLLDTIKDSLIWQTIFENFNSGEAILAGSSAGAMVLGKMVFARVYEFMGQNKLLPWEDSLAVVDFGIIPHYDAVRKDFSEEQWEKMQNEFPEDLEIIGIDEDTAYIKHGNNWKIMGKGKVHKLR